MQETLFFFTRGAFRVDVTDEGSEVGDAVAESVAESVVEVLPDEGSEVGDVVATELAEEGIDEGNQIGRKRSREDPVSPEVISTSGGSGAL